jgi:myosin heavy subunit
MSVLLAFQGTDETMLAKVHKTHERNKNYLKPKSDKTPAFGLSHFAGTVFYDVKGKYCVVNNDKVLTKAGV